MLLRRLYSSLPAGSARQTTSSALAAAPSSPRPASRSTRGRFRPSRVSATQPPLRATSTPTSPSDLAPSTGSASATASTSSLPSLRGRARRRRARLALTASSEAPPRPHLTASDYTFRPIPIYPYQMLLHKSFLPPHMPIPVGLGSQIYTDATFEPPAPAMHEGGGGELGPFAPPPPPSPGSVLRALSLDVARAESAPGSTSETASPSYPASTSTSRVSPPTSALADHLRVTSALSRPDLIHHLGAPVSAYNGVASSDEVEVDGAGDVADPRGADPESYLVHALADAGVRYRLSGEWEWERTLGRLGGSAGGSGSGSGRGTAPAIDVASASPEAGVIPGARASFTSETTGSPATATTTATATTSAARPEADAIDKAVADLTTLLARLETPTPAAGQQTALQRPEATSGTAIEVSANTAQMDSVKRKRRKKITKHKYQKRRKLTKAKRKRLGK